MSMSTTNCGSGCNSGWTLYFDQSSFGGIVHKEEEDLSMVSDASSGPRHYLCEDDNNEAHSLAAAEKNKDKNLEDTASSPVKKNGCKNGKSREDELKATHFKGKSSFSTKHYGSLHSGFADKPATGKHGALIGMKMRNDKKEAFVEIRKRS